MIPKELIKQIRKIEIKSKRLVDSLFAGNFRSAFKGRGLEFEGIRQYFRGDDYRSIDWKVTARMNRPYIKIYREERELIVMILIDVSSSIFFGSTGQTKRELAAEFAATIALSTVASNDQVGLIMFSDRVEKFIPPSKGKTHALRVIREILFYKPVSRKTDLAEGLAFMNRVLKHKSISFVVSDFMDAGERFEKMMAVTRLRHDTVAIMLNDELDTLPYDVGLVDLYDMETGDALLVDTSNAAFVKEFNAEWEKRQRKVKSVFRKNNIDCISLSTGVSIQKPLLQFFRKRETAR